MHDFATPINTPREIDLENGNKLRLTRTDPYGFIYLSLEHGQMPDSLKDAAFTDWSAAETAAKKYVSQRQSVLAEIKHKDAPAKVK